MPRQAGLLLALGWNRRRVRRLLVIEGVGRAAIVGSGLGVVIGLGYAALIIAALQSKIVVAGGDHDSVSRVSFHDNQPGHRATWRVCSCRC